MRQALSDGECCTSEISETFLSPSDVRNALLSLDVNKATGPDKFPSRLLKNCAPRICGSQCALFNKSLSLGTLPSACK